MGISVIPVSGVITRNPPQSIFTTHPTSNLEWHLIGGQQSSFFTHTTNRHAVRTLATANVSPGKRRSSKEVIMVDPLEAKKLAAKQMEEIKAKEKFERRRQIEAINGAWAMIGLAAGLVIEGRTGKGILGQVHIFVKLVIEEAASALCGYYTAEIMFAKLGSLPGNKKMMSQ